MMWFGRMLPWSLWSRVQDQRRRQQELLYAEPDEPLPGSDLSEADRLAALEREAQRRSERNAR